MGIGAEITFFSFCRRWPPPAPLSPELLAMLLGLGVCAPSPASTPHIAATAACDAAAAAVNVGDGLGERVVAGFLGCPAIAEVLR